MGKTVKILSEIGYIYLTQKNFEKKVQDAFPFAKTKKE